VNLSNIKETRGSLVLSQGVYSYDFGRSTDGPEIEILDELKPKQVITPSILLAYVTAYVEKYIMDEYFDYDWDSEDNYDEVHIRTITDDKMVVHVMGDDERVFWINHNGKLNTIADVEKFYNIDIH